MTLLDLQNGEKGIIQKVKGRGAFRRRIIEMGFVSGKIVEVIKKAPLKDPIEYSIMGYNISLRSSEAQLIEVMPIDGATEYSGPDYEGIIISEGFKITRQNGKNINVALVGNPNSGKTSFFNHASGSRERVGNYSGVTVDAKQAWFKQDGYRFNITDLPGTYSISAYSPEEIYVREFITEHLPDVVINIVDSSNFERNLYLTTQLIDMDIKVVMVLNMYDEFQKKGDKLDYESLGKMIGIPMIPAVSSKGTGIKEVFDKVIEVFEDKDKTQRHIHINYGEPVEKSLKILQDKINAPGNQHLTDRVSTRYLALKLLEKDNVIAQTIIENCHNHKDIFDSAGKEIQKLENIFNDTTDTIITDLKYGFINGALKETIVPAENERRKKSEVIDTLLTDKLFGFPIFLFFMWVMFSATFLLGSYPMEWIEEGVEFLSVTLDNTMNPGPLKDLLINGVVSGVGGVIVFLPNIVLLFFFISLMEDTGYMSRAVFIMDKLMHRIGLHGKSFIPLLMGFGCNVPAIMATRTLANRNDRLLTMIINPFISCSARLPVYVLFITAFFPNYQGTMLFMIYAIGILMAVLAAITFKKTLFKGEEVPFVMELPPYRVPTMKAIVIHMWSKAVHYLKKISGIILVASIIIWVLGYFPHGIEYEKLTEQQRELISDRYDAELTNAVDEGRPVEQLLEEKEREIETMEVNFIQKRQENSLIGQLGRFIEPAMAPLGFDWKMSISLLSGLAAKEIVVSTLGVLYQAEDNVQTHSTSLTEKLQSQTHTHGNRQGEKVFTPLVALSFMLFVLLYFPCIGVLAAIIKESGHWKWGVFTVFYTTGVAWLVAFLVFQIGSLLGF
ncbi:MAG: ferrous iron transport protein B [Bacteroidetes bacterium]|nr:MAG: ferrous iron transport protein B [Bacteroidota bacterium]